MGGLACSGLAGVSSAASLDGPTGAVTAEADVLSSLAGGSVRRGGASEGAAGVGSEGGGGKSASI